MTDETKTAKQAWIDKRTVEVWSDFLANVRPLIQVIDFLGPCEEREFDKLLYAIWMTDEIAPRRDLQKFLHAQAKAEARDIAETDYARMESEGGRES